MAFQPGLPGSQMPRKDDWMVKKLRQLESDLQQVRAALGSQTGMTFAKGAIKSATFDGDLDAPSAGNNGVALGGPHDTLIVNDILLKGAIIGNDALTSPVSPAIFQDTVSGRAASSSYATIISGTIPVPSGFSQALVMASGFVEALANGSGGFYNEVKVKIAGVDGPDVDQWTDTGTASSATASAARLVTGLSGGSVAVQAVALQTTVANVVSNSVQGGLSAVALFLR
jgi:hypothetical protein